MKNYIEWNKIESNKINKQIYEICFLEIDNQFSAC